MASHAVDNEQERDTTAGLLSMQASSTLPQRRRGVNRLSWSSVTLDTWALEGVSMVFSVACLISIYGILVAYNGKQRPGFIYNISLNAIVSVLSTGCKSSLVFVVGEGLSQLKWLWFQNRRQLSYMQTFEDASRGPLGSISLLFRHKGRSMASLGSMILIFMLAFDPFVQQILSYPSESIMLANNSLAAAAPQLRYFGTGVSDTDWTSAYYLGIWSTDFNITPSCPSGNCTWPNYRSLGICSHCSDMTSSAKFHCPMPSYNDTRDDDGYFVAEGKCEVILPQGRSSNTTVAVEALYVNESFVGEILFTTHKVWEVSPLHSAESVGWNESFSNIKNPLLVLGQISLGFDSGRIKNASNPTEGVIFKNATQCAFSYCIQEYNVSVTNGKVAIEKSSPDLGKTYEYTSIYNTTETCWRPSHSPSDTVLKYTMLGDDALYLNATEFVFCGNRGIESLPFIGSTTMSWSMDSGSSTWTSGLASGGLVPVASSNENFDRISELGLGVVAPRVAESLTKTNLQGSNITNIPGMVYTNELIVRVQWPWMILPTLLVVLGIMFFAYTMYASRQKIFWKSSMLALLFHGLDDETNVNRDECTTVSMMEKLAEGMHVQLQASQSDGRVMLRGT